MSNLRRKRSSENSEKEKEVVYFNSKMSRVIDEVIHSERDRNLLKRRLLDDITLFNLAEEFDLSPRQVQRIVTKGEYLVFKYYEDIE